MTPANYAPLRSGPTYNAGTVTNMNWCCGGSKSSADNYATYEISVFKHWYVYRHKPSWFGQYPHDRYLGKLRWISSHCDGKQWKNLSQHGDLYGVKVSVGSEKASDKVANELMVARGYLQHHLSSLRREGDYAQHYLTRERTKEIRCTECRITKAEVLRKKQEFTWNLMYPKDSNGVTDWHKTMDRWDAEQITRVHCGCNCDIPPSESNLRALAHSLQSGDAVRLS